MSKDIRKTDTHTLTFTGPQGKTTKGIELRDGKQVRLAQQDVASARARGDKHAALNPLPQAYGKRP